MKVLVACEVSGVVRDAYRARGVEAFSCDTQPSSSPFHIQSDVLDIIDYGWDLMIAHPPCTHLAVSGARWFEEKRKDGRQQKAVDFFMRLANASIPHIAVENPISIMSTVYRKPDQIIQPWQFGHGETKATCLWLKNLPLLAATDVVEGREQRVWRMGPSAQRAALRSRTYEGVAKAMADQWS